MRPLGRVVGPLLALLTVGATAAAAPAAAQSDVADGAHVSHGAHASIDDFAWLAGHWVGEGLGGVAEEIWSPPSNGEMMGVFRHLTADGTTNFYEFFTLTERDGGLVLRIKHFTAGMVGWEDKEDTVDFPLVTVSPGRAQFEGLRYWTEGPDTLHAAVWVTTDGERREVSFRFTRVPAGG